MEIITRKQAKETGQKHYYTGKHCSKGHIEKRLTSTGQCCECIRLNHYKYYEENKKQALHCISQWQKRNKGATNNNTREWRKRNPEQAKITYKTYYETNKSQKLKYNKEWREQNKPLLQYYNAKRRSQILQATPVWADLKSILLIYEESVRITKQTGIVHHVDHFIPLQGEFVCGLHCEDNLRIITANENQSKGNRC